MISANILFFAAFGISFIMGLKKQGFAWLIPFFFFFCLVFISFDPRDDKKEIVATIVVEENERGQLFFRHENRFHFITQDDYLHSWGCITKGDSIHVYMSKNYQFKNIEYNRNVDYRLVKEE